MFSGPEVVDAVITVISVVNTLKVLANAVAYLLSVRLIIQIYFSSNCHEYNNAIIMHR